MFCTRLVGKGWKSLRVLCIFLNIFSLFLSVTGLLQMDQPPGDLQWNVSYCLGDVELEAFGDRWVTTVALLRGNKAKVF